MCMKWRLRYTQSAATAALVHCCGFSQTELNQWHICVPLMVQQQITKVMTLKKKEEEDVRGGEKEWENVDQTDGTADLVAATHPHTPLSDRH